MQVSAKECDTKQGGLLMANSVQHNISAINANRNFGITKGILKSSTEKLSSGYKINRAADDAAGLAISEKMRKQIRGLTQASANAQDGISSVQTAEGALTEVHAMLQRMNELATKAANGTQSENDKQYVQDEVDQLLTEIDRVAETTKFNEIYLLKGNADKSTKTIEVNAHDAGLAGDLTDKGDGTVEFKLDKALKNGDIVKIGGADYTIGQAVTKANFREKTAASFGAELVSAGDTMTIGGKEYSLTNDVDATTAKALGDSIKAGSIVEDANGTRYSITTDKKITIDGTEKDLKNVLDNGWKLIKTVTDKTDNTQHSIVSSLKENEVSVLSTGFDNTAQKFANLAVNGNASTAVTFKEGDSVVQNGNTITATDTAPEDYTAIEKTLNETAADGTTQVVIKHTEDGVVKQSTYTLSTETDLSDTTALKATREYILDQIHDYDEVTIGAGTEVTVVGKDNARDSNSITISEAYNKMADALKDASSIGADSGKEATVKNNADGSFLITKGSVEVKNALEFSLHVGSDADMTNKIGVKIESMDTAGLGIQGLKVSGDTVANATYAIDAIEDAINKVSSQRSALGAAQNRLEHTIKNLDNIVENTTAAEQEIRDTDMATEMVKFSNANILAQAGQSMLAQANQGNQGILSLLG